MPGWGEVQVVASPAPSPPFSDMLRLPRQHFTSGFTVLHLNSCQRFLVKCWWVRQPRALTQPLLEVTGAAAVSSDSGHGVAAMRSCFHGHDGSVPTDRLLSEKCKL